MNKLDGWMQRLYDLLLIAAPYGVPRDDLMEDLGIMADPVAGPTAKEIVLFHEIKGKLQDKLGLTDVVTVVGHQENAGEPWVYSLQGDPKNPVSEEYLKSRAVKEFATECRSYLVSRALAAGVPGNTTIGKYIQKVQRQGYRKLEDSAELLDELGERVPSMPPQPPRWRSSRTRTP